MPQNLSINANGAVVYWKCKDGDRSRLAGGLSQAGFQKFVPGPRSDSAALKAGIRSICEHNKGRGFDKLILAHKDQEINGFEVRNVRREENVNDLTFDFSAVVRQGTVEIMHGVVGDRELSQLQQAYDLAKTQVTAAEVGGVLVKIVEHLGGVILRPHGGVYWLPDAALEQFRPVANVVELATASSVYQVKTVIDGDTIRAVKDAIIEEVTDAALKARQELRDNNTSPTVVKNRAKYATELHKRVNQYEQILGEALQSLHDCIGVIETEARAAQALQDTETTFAGIF